MLLPPLPALPITIKKDRQEQSSKEENQGAAHVHPSLQEVQSNADHVQLHRERGNDAWSLFFLCCAPLPFASVLK